MNNLASMENCPGVQGNLNWMPGYCSTGPKYCSTVPLLRGKGVFIIVSPSIELSKSHWMSCPRILIDGYDICWEGNGYQALYYLVEQDQS